MKTQTFCTRSVSRLSAITLLLTSVFATGCEGEWNKDYREDLVGQAPQVIDSVAFCAKIVMDSAGASPAGLKAEFRAVIVDRSTNEVFVYTATTRADQAGIACAEMSTHYAGFGVSGDPSNLNLKSLSLYLSGSKIARNANGVVTSASVEPGKLPYFEALFDLSKPNPGDPGALALVELVGSRLGALMGAPRAGSRRLYEERRAKAVVIPAQDETRSVRPVQSETAAAI